MTRYRPTFVVTVTPTEIVSGDTSRGQPYSTLKDAVVSQKGRADSVRTVMAFGSAGLTAEKLLPGVPVDIAVQHDGGTLRMVGLPRAAN